MDAPQKNPSQLAGQDGPSDHRVRRRVRRGPGIDRSRHPRGCGSRSRPLGSGARAMPRARRKFGGVRLLWLLVGPGVLVFLGENDAPSMLSYSADGSRYGVGFFHPVRRPHFHHGIHRAGNDRAPRRRHPSRPRRTDLRSLRKILGLLRHGRLDLRKFSHSGH